MDATSPAPAIAKKGAVIPDSVRQKKRARSLSTQRYLPIAEIREDTVVLKNGGLRAVLRVNPVNFNLKSEVEQQGIIAGYQGFLNTLLFPVQILVRSTRLNVDPYIQDIRRKATQQQNPLMKTQAEDYALFMEKLVDVADIMQKTFYVIVPIDAPSRTKRGVLQRFMDWMNIDDSKARALQRSREFQGYAKILRDRVTLVQSGLENVGLTMKRLKNDELVQLYYSIYNPSTSQKEKIGSLKDLKTDPGMVF